MSPPLSAVVPTTKPWPYAEATLETLRSQATATNTEIVVADGHGTVPTDLGATFRTLSLPGADVFALRAAAVEHASGDLVALLEDHLLAPVDWCQRVLDAFDENPGAAGVVGTFANASPALIDRASFLITSAPFLAPLHEVPPDRTPVPGTVTYRRSEIPSGPHAPGWLEFGLPVTLRDHGRLVADDRVQMLHRQHVGWRGFVLHYHSGRACTGLQHSSSFMRGRQAQLLWSLRVPAVVTGQTRGALRQRATTESRACWLAIGALAACNGLGQTVGILRGSAGSSPNRLG